MSGCFLGVFFLAWGGLCLHLPVRTAQEVVWTLCWQSAHLQITAAACSSLSVGAASKMQHLEKRKLGSNCKTTPKYLAFWPFWFVEFSIMHFAEYACNNKEDDWQMCMSGLSHGGRRFQNTPFAVSCWVERYLHQAPVYQLYHWFAVISQQPVEKGGVLFVSGKQQHLQGWAATGPSARARLYPQKLQQLSHRICRWHVGVLLKSPMSLQKQEQRTRPPRLWGTVGGHVCQPPCKHNTALLPLKQKKRSLKHLLSFFLTAESKFLWTTPSLSPGRSYSSISCKKREKQTAIFLPFCSR